MPAVTLLLPVFNSAATLGDTLASLLAQTFTDFELLVIDDGSTDDTPAILTSIRDPRLRVLRNPTRLRLAGALNRGIDEAAAPLIARMDADDLARPSRLERQVAFMRDTPHIALSGTWTRHFGDRSKARETYPTSHDALRAFALFNCPFAHPTVIFRTELFRQHNLRYDPTFYPTEDFELWTRVVHRFPCANLPHVLLDYRVHAKSMTGSDWDNMDAQARRLMAAQLHTLGVPFTSEQVRLLRDIGMARVQAHELPAARDTLAALLDHNQNSPFCPESALLAETRERWYHTCMNLRGSRPDRPRLYASPRFWQHQRPPLLRRTLLHLSSWRRSFTP